MPRSSERGPLEGPRRGRRPAGEDTRALILGAARAEFAERGFDATSMRAVARSAGVDPALVRHYFTSKADLLGASLVPGDVDAPATVAALTDGPPGGLGERLARTVLAVWDNPDGRARLRAVLSGTLSADPEARVFVDYVRDTVLGGLSGALEGPDVERRVAMVASQVIGLLVTRIVIGLEPLASMAGDEVVAAVGPTLQRYLDGPVAPSRPSSHNSSHGE